MEINGWVYLWHHAEGIEPNWTPPEIEQITAGSWLYKGRTEHYINAHIEVRNIMAVAKNGGHVMMFIHVL